MICNLADFQTSPLWGWPLLWHRWFWYLGMRQGLDASGKNIPFHWWLEVWNLVVLLFVVCPMILFAFMFSTQSWKERPRLPLYNLKLRAILLWWHVNRRWRWECSNFTCWNDEALSNQDEQGALSWLKTIFIQTGSKKTILRKLPWPNRSFDRFCVLSGRARPCLGFHHLRCLFSLWIGINLPADGRALRLTRVDDQHTACNSWRKGVIHNRNLPQHFLQIAEWVGITDVFATLWLLLCTIISGCCEMFTVCFCISWRPTLLQSICAPSMFVP